MLRREVRDLARAHEQRRRQLPRAILVGVLAGLAAVAFRATLAALERARDGAIANLGAAGGWGFVPIVLLTAAGSGLAVWLVARFAPEASGSGIPHVKAVLHGLRDVRWARVLAIKFSAGVTGIGAGLALGREGPTVQMGAAIGQMVSGWFRCTARERRTLIAAGAGAGLSAAFNAPLAGLVFVLEELQRNFVPSVFAIALLASVVADVVTRVLLGQLPVFHTDVPSIPPLTALPVSLVIGVAAGALGILFNRGLVASLDLFQRLPSRRDWLRPLLRGVLAGAVVGVVGWFAPRMIGGGGGLVEATLDARVSSVELPLHFVTRFVLTMVSYGCGAAGGIFAPLLLLGSEIGLAIGRIGAHLMPSLVAHPRTFAVVGMAAYFSAIVRAPLTGIVLMVEMTGDYELVLPLLVASLTAYGVAEWLGDRPIYEALLERDLLRGEDAPPLEKTLLIEVVVAPGTRFDGKRVRDLGLPPGCVLVTIRRGIADDVPTANTIVEAGDVLTAVVAAGDSSAIDLLRRGAESSE